MERKVEYQREYYAKNPEKYVEYTRRHRERHPEAYETKQRRGRLRREFGLTLEDYDAMVAAQDGVCFLCKRPPSGRLKRLCVDHDHATGKVRKLLCDRCNRTLGFFDEDATLFDRAAEYLRRTW